MSDALTTDTITPNNVPKLKNKSKIKYITTKAIKEIEGIIRKSPEYKNLINFIKLTLDVSTCSYYEGYSMKNGFTVELHHSPLTLFDIVETIVNKCMEEDSYYIYNMVAKEATMMHYSFMVGLVPLNVTAHQLTHSGKLPIHPDIVLGNWKAFHTKYKEHMVDEIIKKLEKAISIQKSDQYQEFPEILLRKEQMINNDSMDLLVGFNEKHKLLLPLEQKQPEPYKEPPKLKKLN